MSTQDNAGGGSRTHTDSRPANFKSAAAAITPRPQIQATFLKSGFEPEMSIFQIDALTVWLLSEGPSKIAVCDLFIFLQDHNEVFS